MNYKNIQWRKDMKIKIDYNNMMSEYVGEKEGFTAKDFTDNKKIIAEAYATVCANRGSGMMGWTELPYNQNEIVADIIATAKDIKKKFDNFEKFTHYIMYIGGNYGRKEFEKCNVHHDCSSNRASRSLGLHMVAEGYTCE